MSDDNDPSDEELAAAAQCGDAAAFDSLARRYLRRAMALAWHELRRVEDAEDAVQEAFHRAVRSLRDFDPEREFGPWFFTIVRNVARSARSKSGRRRELVPVQSLSTVDAERCAAEPGADHVLASTFSKALSSLPRMQQACLRLCEIEGYTSAEAGAMLGVAEGTVRTHLFRARTSLRTTVTETKESV